MELLVARDLVYQGLHFVTQERIDPFLLSLSSIANGESQVLLFAFLQALVFFLGSYFLFLFLDFSKRSSALRSLLLLISCGLVLGLEPVSWRLHWFPFLQLSYFLAMRNKTLGFVLLLPMLALWTLSSGTLSLVGILFALLCALAFEREKSSSRFFLVTNCIALIVAYLLLPFYIFADYPAGAQLAPLSGVVPLPRPLFGPYYHVRTIVESAYRRELLLAGGLSMGIFLSLLLAHAVSQKTWRNRALFIAFPLSLVFSFFICGELILGNESREFGLFATASRLIPGVALSAFPWVYFPFFALPLFALLGPKKGQRFELIVSVCLLPLFVLAFYKRPDAYALTQTDIKYLVGNNVSEGVSRASYSPESSFVVSYWGEWILDPTLEKQRSYDRLKWLRYQTDYIATFTAQPLAEEAWMAGDNDQATRWRTARPQAEGDYIQAVFDREVSVVKIVFSIKQTPNDFPRGVKLEILQDGTWRTSFEKKDWIGPVKWTPSGKPYFGSQSEVIFELAKDEVISGVRLTQISSDTTFDWSVGELKLFSSLL